MLLFWKVLSFLGSEEFYLLIMPALLWCMNAQLGVRVGVLFLLSANLNSAAKLFFHAPRPAWVDPKIVAHGVETSFGFPSGHAQSAVVVWGLLAAKAKTKIGWGVALTLCALIGISRLALNVHFPGDVLGGWLIGALLLGAFLKLEKPLVYWFKKQSFLQQLLFCAALSFGLVALQWWLAQWLLYAILNDPENTLRWFDRTVVGGNITGLQESLNPRPDVKTSGALFGLLAGACLVQKTGGYVNGGNKVLRYVVGLFGVLVFWLALGKVLPRGEDWVSLIAAYNRYALTGFWISAGAPLLFRCIEKNTSQQNKSGAEPISKA
jgi:hypothetical protein